MAITKITDGTNEVSISASNAMKVDGSATTQPVSGTVTANAGTGTFNVAGTGTAGTAATGVVTIQGIASMVAVKVDGSATTQPVSGTVTANAGTGTFTVADNQAITDNAAFTDGTSKVFVAGYIFDETAGTALTENDAAAARVDSKRAQILVIEDATTRGQRAAVSAAGAVKVDGSAVTQPVSGTVTANIGTTNGLALDSSVNALSLAQASTTSGQKGILGMGAVTTAAPTYTTAQTNPLSLTTAGALRVDGSGSTQPVSGTVTANAGTGTFTTSNSETITDNAAFTDGTSKVFVAGYIFDETAGTALTENDAAAARVDSKRAQVLVIEDATTRGQRATVTAANAVKMDGSAVTQPVSGTVTANAGTGTFTTSNSETITDNAAFTDGTSKVFMGGYVFDETAGTALTENDAAAARVDSKRAQVFVMEDATTRGQRATVTAANAVKVDGSAVTQPVSQATASSLNAQVQGNVAHDAVDSGNPVKIGAVARTTNPTAATNGDRTNLSADKLGKLINTPFASRELVVTGTITLTTTTETTIIAAGGAGVFHDVVQLIITNSSNTQTNVLIRDATGGTVRMTADIGTTVTGGGSNPMLVMPFTTPWPQTTANNNWTAQLGTAATSIHIFMMAVKNV